MPGTTDKSVQGCVRFVPRSTNAAAAAKRVLAVVLTMAFVAASAQGSVIEYQFSGVITSADPSTGVAAGTPFTGSFSYDTTTMSPGPGYEGDWQVTYGGLSPSSADAFSLKIGGQTVFQESGALGLGENFLTYAGQYGYHDGNGDPMPAHTTFSITGDSSGGLSAGLNLSNPATWNSIDSNQIGGFNLGQLPSSSLWVSSVSGSGSDPMLYEGKLTSLMTVPLAAPEPGPVWLAVAGALWLVGSRRSVKRPQR